MIFDDEHWLEIQKCLAIGMMDAQKRKHEEADEARAKHKAAVRVALDIDVVDQESRNRLAAMNRDNSELNNEANLMKEHANGYGKMSHHYQDIFRACLADGLFDKTHEEVTAMIAADKVAALDEAIEKGDAAQKKLKAERAALDKE